jgi:hypothetical protein
MTYCYEHERLDSCDELCGPRMDGYVPDLETRDGRMSLMYAWDALEDFVNDDGMGFGAMDALASFQEFLEHGAQSMLEEMGVS